MTDAEVFALICLGFISLVLLFAQARLFTYLPRIDDKLQKVLDRLEGKESPPSPHEDEGVHPVREQPAPEEAPKDPPLW